MSCNRNTSNCQCYTSLFCWFILYSFYSILFFLLYSSLFHHYYISSSLINLASAVPQKPRSLEQQQHHKLTKTRLVYCWNSGPIYNISKSNINILQSEKKVTMYTRIVWHLFHLRIFDSSVTLTECASE